MRIALVVLCGLVPFVGLGEEVDIDTLCPPRPETAAKYEPGTYPAAARPYREAAMAVYRYITVLPAMTALVETGKPWRLYQHNAYVAKTHAAHIVGMIRWAKADPSAKETAMKFAKASAEFLLSELEPAYAPLAYWPPTYGRQPLEYDPETDGPYEKPSMLGNEPIGAPRYRGEEMLIYPADVGTAFLAYYAETKDARFLEAAKGIAETYLKTRRADKSWPLKMKLATGEPIGENTLVPDRTIVFFEALFDATRDPRWRQAADDCFAWLEAHPLANWNWDGQFEDIRPCQPYKNPTKHNAIEAMMYLLRRFPGDKARLATCRKILEFCEKRFVVWKAPPNHPHWPAPSVLEQYSCFTPIDASAAKMIRGYVAMYKAEGRAEDLEKARAIANTITRLQRPSGRIPTFWEGVNTGDSGVSDERYDWLNCMEGSAAALLELAEAEKWPVLRSYAGEHLRRVKMPLGGIGTGTISLAGNGALVDWEIRSKPSKGFVPGAGRYPWFGLSPFFALRTETSDGDVKARILEGPVDSEYYEGHSGARACNHGFTRWRGCTFRVAYPLAQVALEDPALPVTATLEAMNPLLPGDADASGIPAALLRWKITNVSAAPLKASVFCLLANPASGAGSVARVEQDGLTGVRLGAEGPDLLRSGEITLALPQDSGAITTATESGNELDNAGLWQQFVDSGKAGNGGRRAYASVAVAFDLQPGETKTLPFALAWRFAHRYGWSKGADGKPVDLGNWYATRYPTALAAAQDLLTNLVAYEKGTVAFVRSVLAKRAPDVVKEAALFNLSTLRTETCFRTADGHFFSWEGCFDDEGVCSGTCTHVWGYEHALIDVWPSLAKDMTELQFGTALDERGCMHFRIVQPLEANRDPKIPRWDAADGHLQCLVKAYENWRKTGDDAWMRKLYPNIRRALEFVWIENGWDGDGDGVIEGCQHNTMDVEYVGPNPQMEFLYLAALKAAAAMADGADDAAFAAKCRALAEKGSAWTEANLFNGDYYEQKVVPMTVTPAEGTYPRNVKDLAHPDRQLGDGCLVDQLLGDYAARAVGLGPVADERHAQKTLETILERNASANFEIGFNHMRGFALPDEPSLKMAWYPKDRREKHPFPYYTETMTGFEYVVAAALAQRGDFARAERVVRDIRGRYDGKKRNPFDEAECGHHYVRALAAWTVLRAFTGE